MKNETVKSIVSNNFDQFDKIAQAAKAAAEMPNAIDLVIDRNNRITDFVKKAGEILPHCAVTRRCEPGEFRGHLLQQTTLSQAAESSKSRRKVQRIDGEKGINNPSTSSRHPNCILHYNTP